MSYCRFGSEDSDVYMYHHCGGFIECCSCLLANKVKTIFTTGHTLSGKKTKPCKQCKGKGCEACMIHDSVSFKTRKEAIQHLKEHEKQGHIVPKHAYERLEQEIKEEGNEIK